MSRTRKGLRSTYYHVKKQTEFQKIAQLGKEAGNFSHRIFKVQKNLEKRLKDGFPDNLIPERYKHTWYFKEETDDPVNAILEVIAQECFRLLIPGYPKTRLVLGEKNALNILCKEVIGFKPFLLHKDPVAIKQFQEAIASRKYTGLGAAVLVSLLLCEGDLKFDNMGTDANNVIIKLDAGWCFARSFSPEKNYAITKENLASLPLVTNYEASNWLDVREARSDGGVNVNTESKILTPEVLANYPLCEEINVATLCALSIPESLWEEFMYACIPLEVQQKPKYDEVIQECIEEICDRTEQLKNAALENKDFMRYLKTQKAQEDLTKYIAYLKDFTLTGKRQLNLAGIEEELENTIKRLQTTMPTIASSPPTLFAPPREEQAASETWDLSLSSCTLL